MYKILRFSIVVILSVVPFCFSAAQLNENPDYYINSYTVTSGGARFQFLDPNLIRMEYAPSDKFIDHTTAVVTNREWHGKRPDGDVKDGWLSLTADKITVHYKLGSGSFTHENLRITWKESGKPRSWSPGDTDAVNLGGIISSLDGASKKSPLQFRPGILSRNGWFVLDDSRSPLWDSTADWITPRPSDNEQDLYFFRYGSDYRMALRLFTQLCGKIPMIPRYTLGPWITDLNYEYFPGTENVSNSRYTDKNIKDIVERFRSENIPLDILVLDFAWHKYGWKGGYDWSPIFSDPKNFLNWAHRDGIKISLNDHPGYGDESVLADEDSRAAEVRKVLDMEPSPKPKYSLDLTANWKFKTDPKDAGLKNSWFDLSFNDSSWTTLQGAGLWEEQGFPEYDGIAWYRKWVEIPKDIPTPFYMMFGGVDDEYDLFINGVKIAHQGSTDNSVYNRLTSIDVALKLKRGAKNLIVLRVNDWGGGGGIVKGPVGLADQLPGEGIRFNLAEKNQADAFMNVLHNPLVDLGIDFWWIDGGRGSARMAGLNPQMWTNRVYYDFTEQHTRKRAFVFSRYGGWGNHRYPGLFTGDTYSDWEVLAQEIPYTACAGNALIPYVTHDIGGFLGQNISFDLYARWVQFGVFSPLLRLHSAYENPRDGNVRMPWKYGDKGIRLARKYFQLRNHLIPYLYTYSRVAQDSALPLVRPLYLQYPNSEQSYTNSSEYMFGSELLVAPITDSSGERYVYLPPGDWIDCFTGATITGDQTVHKKCDLFTMPLFARAGAIIPGAPVMAYSDQRPLDTLILDVYGEGKSDFKLYEDDGVSLNYRAGQYAWTLLQHEKAIGGGEQVTIYPTKGKFDRQPTERAYIIKLYGISRPSSAKVNFEKLPAEKILWDSESSVASIFVKKMSIKETVRVIVR